MMPTRVLLFIDWYRPGYKAGGPVQSCTNLVEHLQGPEVQFFIVTRDTDYCETTPYASIRSDAWNTRPDGSQVYYISAAQLNGDTLKRLVRETPADMIYINGIYSRWFSIAPLRIWRKLRPTARIVVAARGMLAPSAIAIKPFRKKLFLAVARFTRLYRNVLFHATGTHEAAHIRAVLGNVTVHEAGNLPQRLSAPLPQRNKQLGHIRLICVARIAPEKNIDYALRVLQKVTAIVTLDIIGPVYNESYAETCYQLARTLPANITVNFCGAVPPDELPAHFAATEALLFPSRGENFGHVILQAFAAGCPVIISDQTPWRNLQSQHTGWDLSLATPEKFTETIDLLANMDAEMYNQWSANAWELARKYSTAEELVTANKLLVQRV